MRIRIKGEPLTVASDEGVREVITLHLNAQLVRRQYRIGCLSAHSEAPPRCFFSPILQHPTADFPLLDCWNRAHVTNERIELQTLEMCFLCGSASLSTHQCCFADRIDLG